MTTEKKIEKAALLLLLEKGDRRIDNLAEVFCNLQKMIRELSEYNNIDIFMEDSLVGLESNIVIDLFQDIPPEVREEIRKKVEEIDPEFVEYELIEQKRPIIDPFSSDIDPKSIKDFRPEPPFPVIWEDKVGVPGATDSHPTQVCPENSIQQLDNGRIVLEDERCPGCLLAAIKDPFNTIKIKDGLEFEIDRYTKDDSVTWKEITRDEREEITSYWIDRYRQPRRRFSKQKIRGILDDFQKRVGPDNRRWDQTPYYIFVRNCLRLLGMDARYTGGPGMKTRSDVTVYDPFYLTIEVKSPAEGKVNQKAVRQAFDSSIPFEDQLDEPVYRAAIGHEISNDAIEQAGRYQRTHNIFTPLITGRVLLFLVLLNAYANLRPGDFESLFRDISGELTQTQLINFYEDQYTSGNSSLSDSDAEEFVTHCIIL